MLRRLSWKLTAALMERAGDTGDKEIYVYGVECFLAEALQCLLLLAVGLLMGRLAEVIAFALFFTTIKRNAGGFHASRHITCISGFTALAVAAVMLAGIALPWIAQSLTALVGMSVSCRLVWRYGPLAHPDHPKTAEEIAVSRGHCRRIVAVQMGMVLLSTLLLFGYPSLWLSATAGSLAAAISLLLPNCAGREV